MVPNDLSRRDASIDMQHDLIGSWPDLDLRSNFDLDLSRSSGICFESSWREKHDGVKIISVSLLVQKLFTKNDFRQKRKFLVWGPLEPKLLNLGRIWRKNVTGAWKGLSNAFFGFFLAVILFEIITIVCGKITIFLKNDLWWPLVTSILTLAKKWPKCFRNHFWRALERFFPFLATTPSSQVRGGGFSNTPPPSMWRKI